VDSNLLFKLTVCLLLYAELISNCVPPAFTESIVLVLRYQNAAGRENKCEQRIRM